MQQCYFLLIFLLFSCNPSVANKYVHQVELEDGKIDLVFYNVENLFDIYDDPKTNDDEYTPESEKEWDQIKYEKKLDQLFRVLDAMEGSDVPELIGLSEVENADVLSDLIECTPLKDKNYQFAHEDSPDQRGIDCAFLYDADVFKVKEISPLSVQLPAPFDKDSTRDVLYIEGLLIGTPIHIFVNHWSSRRGGLAKSEPKRLAAAQVVKDKVDLIILKDADAKIVLMGDFNDSPGNKSIREVLDASLDIKDVAESDLYNPFYALEESGDGSYNYKGNWNMLDQIMVSTSLLDLSESIHFSPNGAIGTIRKDFMMYQDKKYGQRPSRTYGGNRYFGGYSDHLPVYLSLTCRSN